MLKKFDVTLIGSMDHGGWEFQCFEHYKVMAKNRDEALQKAEKCFSATLPDYRIFRREVEEVQEFNPNPNRLATFLA